MANYTNKQGGTHKQLKATKSGQLHSERTRDQYPTATQSITSRRRTSLFQCESVESGTTTRKGPSFFSTLFTWCNMLIHCTVLPKPCVRVWCEQTKPTDLCQTLATKNKQECSLRTAETSMGKRTNARGKGLIRTQRKHRNTQSKQRSDQHITNKRQKKRAPFHQRGCSCGCCSSCAPASSSLQ